MEPENFVNLLLDHIETRSPLPKHHNFDLYNCQLLSEVAYKFASEKVKNYNDVLLRYIFSHNIAPNCDLMFNAKFLTQLLVKRLQNCLNPKAFTQILKFFNTLELDSTDDHDNNNHNKCKDEVTWLLDEEELDILINNDSDNFTQSKPIKILIIERCNMLKRTLACEELEISRLIDGIMRMSKNKLNYPYTDEEIKLSKKLYVLQNLLEYIINYPTEYRQLANKFIESITNSITIIEMSNYSRYSRAEIIPFYSGNILNLEEILENLPRLENDEMISLLFDIATLVSNSPIKKCENDNLLKSNHKFIRDFNRIFLDIWLTLFSRIIIYENKPYINNDKQRQIYSSTPLLLQSKSTKLSSSSSKLKKSTKSSKSSKSLPSPSPSTEKILYVIISFLENFNGSLKFIWLIEFNNNYNNSDNEDDLEMEDKHREEDTVEEDEDG
ncbi:3471_t:CDS:10 [Entrophospora sp. SA101]|nr:3471_t:CDS:10 [Entrophospora sp. SA101]